MHDVVYGQKSNPAAVGKNRALIVVGLPGDEDHTRSFAAVAHGWREWLVGPLGFEANEVRVLFGLDGRKGLAKGPSTRAAIEAEVTNLKKELRPEDRLWVFFLGHGNYDGEHAYFHVPGPDLNESQMGKLFADVNCREQVFWMTTSASGWFLGSLSRKDRIVITATAGDDEFNETEFPEALAVVAKLPVARLDTNKDGKVSLLEFYLHVVTEVERRFAADNRVPTEHSQLDDNGDKKGTERPVVEVGIKVGKPTADGHVAAKTFLPYKLSNNKE
jgi:hypothetical protein